VTAFSGGLSIVSRAYPSEFWARAIALVRAGTQQKLTAHELDYGVFEGGPFWDYGAWLRRHGVYARPAGSVESQHAGLSRMAAALRQVLELPGQPLVIGHGLLLSVITHVISGGSPTDQVFPEAGYLLPVEVTAQVLTALACGLAAAYRDRPGHDPASVARLSVAVRGVIRH
jgi:probable phosphoglycerate mutase